MLNYGVAVKVLCSYLERIAVIIAIVVVLCDYLNFLDLDVSICEFQFHVCKKE